MEIGKNVAQLAFDQDKIRRMANMQLIIRVNTGSHNDDGVNVSLFRLLQMREQLAIKLIKGELNNTNDYHELIEYYNQEIKQILAL